jgi:hypothetical protein
MPLPPPQTARRLAMRFQRSQMGCEPGPCDRPSLSDCGQPPSSKALLRHLADPVSDWLVTWRPEIKSYSRCENSEDAAGQLLQSV